jgi:hypothetical protein
MNEPTMLTPTDEQAVRAAGAAWCSEETFARIWATLDAAREELRLTKQREWRAAVSRDAATADAQIVALIIRLGKLGGLDIAYVQNLWCTRFELLDESRHWHGEAADLLVSLQELSLAALGSEEAK